jgi:putative ABC transport system ATP-binding protein|tara:strand:+ start:23330 stop:23968 length:639 start_codon:yes stop_codon:yes gene_type:complete
MITISKLNKTYFEAEKKTKLFNNFNFVFEGSKVYSVVGPSGSGKTTLLNLLCGLDKFENGSIKVNDSELKNLNETSLDQLRKKYFGFGFQFHYLLEGLTVKENCLAANFGEEINALDSLFEKLGIPDKADDYPRNLSGGEKQRAAIARAVCSKPPILLLDEPTGNLDQENSLQIQEFLLEHAKLNNSLLIFATHDEAFANKADYTLRITGEA